jgi:ribose-phosphate pyrophosphokinase
MSDTMIWINDVLIENKRFPNNEILLDAVGILKASKFGMLKEPVIRFKYRTDSDLIELFMTKNYLSDKLKTGARIYLEIMYMPYSRMDRIKDEKDAFTLRYISNFINGMGFEHIRIMEAHSDVCLALVNARNIPIVKRLAQKLRTDGIIKDDDYLFFPDAGAQKKYEDVEPDLPRLVGYKNRDWNTGKITEYKMLNPGKDLNTSSNVFIVDDLCSKGGTAYHAGLALKEMGFENIYLIVAHCEDSIFEGHLTKEESPVKLIYTTDTITDMPDGTRNIKVYPVKELM